MTVDVNYFPGWTRKAITFTIDDGSIPNDLIFLSIVKPKGFLGTFNLTSADRAGYTHDDYRRIYRGYEIANHCKHHPQAIPDDFEDVVFMDEVYDEATAIDGGRTLYRDARIDGIYWAKDSSYHQGKRRYAKNDDYIRFIEQGQTELEAVFGEGSVGAFVWPYAEQRNEAVKSYVKSRGFYAIRKTGNLADKTGFALPSDRSEWLYNCGYMNLLEVAELFEKYPDDGELKLFTFGIHSADYVLKGKLDDLKIFADKYGARPEDYYYATNRDIFEYEDAVKSVVIEDGKITNPSPVTLYIKVDGERLLLHGKETLTL